MKFDVPLHPAWLGHMLHGLAWQGWKKPRINDRRHVTAEPPSETPSGRINLSSSDEGVEALAQAFVFADLASGADFGGYLMNRLIPGPLPDRLKFKREELFPSHNEFLSFLVMSHEFASQHIAAQLQSKEH